MEEFLTKVAALGRIPEPELGKVQHPGVSACTYHCECRVRDSILEPLFVPRFCPPRGLQDDCRHKMSSPTKARQRGCWLAVLRRLLPSLVAAPAYVVGQPDSHM